MIRRGLLYFHTLRHLRGRQIRARLWRLLRSRGPGAGLRRPPADVACSPPSAKGRSAISDSILTRAYRLRDGVFTAVGVEVPVADLSWTAAVGSPLLTYHVQYFDEAPALAALWSSGDKQAGDRLRSLWEGWLDATSDGRGVAWDPYPISCRLPNWIEALGHAPDTELDPRLRRRIEASLWIQADRLARTLEVDLQGNHLLKNRIALVWASACLWPPPVPLERAVEQLLAELDSQILSDGMHEERTPAYHCMALDDLLGVIEMLRTRGVGTPEGLARHAEAMARVLRPFVAPSGRMHPFSDSVPYPTPEPKGVIERASRILDHVFDAPEGPWLLRHAGYGGSRVGRLTVAFDAGPFGAVHQPGHGHCDALSFELLVGDTPIIVDPGIAGYAGDPHRTWARSTAAHNTIQVDGREQTEIWSVFRAARRASAGGIQVKQHGTEVELAGENSPWHAPSLRHRRSLRISPDQLLVSDQVVGARGRRLDTRLHFAASASLEEVRTGTWRLSADQVALEIEPYGVSESRLETGKVFPGWNRVQDGSVLRCTVHPGPASSHSLGFRIRLLT